MNEWIKEVIIERYEALSEKAESKSELMALKDQAAAYEKILIGQLSDDTQEVMSQWMELHDQMISLQKQWLYVKGVQDGLQLLIFLLFNEEMFES
ncbi:DUF6809 family protein [Cohnella silvisoli]|uniref:DUF4298 domain-containing protein n=1 Tax=Cohnella silvisoli TaxID=2873699 RepID=A0ABV1KP95_9BACL|nr:DUF6809 family protein [Cohnella silvisoli]MCD9020226.1 hypothetical protein [Cohnella silvisoli]